MKQLKVDPPISDGGCAPEPALDLRTPRERLRQRLGRLANVGKAVAKGKDRQDWQRDEHRRRGDDGDAD